jgi:surface polysaccharide O-acyltransferase-like enzyme
LLVWLGSELARRPDLRIGLPLILPTILGLFLLQTIEKGLLMQEVPAGAGRYAFTILTYPLAGATLLFAKAIPASIWPKSLAAISRHTFGIYVLHLAVLSFIVRLVPVESLFSLTCAIVLTIAATAVAVVILKQVPFLCRCLR